MLRMERVRNGPAYDFVSPCVCHDMKVDYARIRLNVCDVGNPEAVGTVRDKIPDEVLVLAVVMVGIGSVTPALGLQHKVVSVDHFVELVAAGHLFREYGL